MAIAAALLFAAPAGARLNDYQEGNTDVDPGSAFVYSVKPVSGANSWYWYFNNNSAGQNSAICYRYRVNGGTYKAPNGANWAAPSAGGFGALPNANASICEGPIASGDDGYATQALSGLTNDMKVEYCAKEWIKFGNIGWDQSAIPERCQAVRIDTADPTASVQLTENGSPVSTTDEPGNVLIEIGYADSASPPWFRGNAYGDNRICQVTNRDCTFADTFDFVDVCSNGLQALNQTFFCGLNPELPDGTYHLCFVVFDGALVDGEPSNLTLDPVTTNQTFQPGTGGRSLACDTITVAGGGGGGGGGGGLFDTTPPDTKLGKHPPKKTAKRKATFTFTATEEGSTFECKLDKGAFKACSSPFKKRVSKGRHSFAVQATDDAGNTDPSPATYRWKVTG